MPTLLLLLRKEPVDWLQDFYESRSNAHPAPFVTLDLAVTWGQDMKAAFAESLKSAEGA